MYAKIEDVSFTFTCPHCHKTFMAYADEESWTRRFTKEVKRDSNSLLVVNTFFNYLCGACGQIVKVRF